MTYIMIKKPIKDSIFCFNKNSIKSWGSYLSMGIPTCLLLCFEWWAYDLQQIVVSHSSSSDKEIQLSTQIVATSVFQIAYCIGIAMLTVNSILAAKYASLGKVNELKKSFWLCTGIGTGLTLVVCAFFLGLSTKVLEIFTDDPEVIEEGEKVMPYICLSILLGGIRSSLQGFLVGVRKELFTTVVCFSSYYIVIFGLSILFVLVLDFGDLGVWISTSVGYGLISLVFIVKILLIDYDQVIKETKEGMAKDHAALNKINDQDEEESICEE
eukprot:CAMPEP_0170527438 /NCGR_PEP_ID=MMETSP0209-20121228/12899_1 /TAXON_ID=665100 ORGANISM="Litonotus pictus, Strain P1" /NCGR_SAMPLE_ID=MMETSP0209 /ASSEMBLY_ACC=CAM_ASM_000301 /LENGTH=268 /DNA_ID=CAMNT_0010817947 /DNA_START=697 /DNA_END=1500 /DNA_ORIENTATION=-